MQQADPFRAFVALVLAVLLAVMSGWIMVVGKSILLPILVAVISTYVLVTASNWLGRQRLSAWAPEWLRRLLVLAAFVLAVFALVGEFVSTAEQVLDRLPVYKENLETMVIGLMQSFGVDQKPNWSVLVERFTDTITAPKLISFGLSSLGSMSGAVFMVVIYAMFLMSERASFEQKIATAMPGESAKWTQEIVHDINQAIGDYLAAKTLVNVILGALSLVVMLFFGVDFAIFWAILIGLLNYIPYVGSLMGVVFPVLLTLAQFGSLQTTLLVAGCLTALQIWVGNGLEPRLIGRRVNMSPTVVLISLSVWSALWGLPGAILAIPITSILAIVLGSFAVTRPLAVLLAEDVTSFETKEA